MCWLEAGERNRERNVVLVLMCLYGGWRKEWIYEGVGFLVVRMVLDDEQNNVKGIKGRGC
jgi:hypothetical protein